MSHAFLSFMCMAFLKPLFSVSEPVRFRAFYLRRSLNSLRILPVIQYFSYFEKTKRPLDHLSIRLPNFSRYKEFVSRVFIHYFLFYSL